VCVGHVLGVYWGVLGMYLGQLFGEGVTNQRTVLSGGDGVFG